MVIEIDKLKMVVSSCIVLCILMRKMINIFVFLLLLKVKDIDVQYKYIDKKLFFSNNISCYSNIKGLIVSIECMMVH